MARGSGEEWHREAHALGASAGASNHSLTRSPRVTWVVTWSGAVAYRRPVNANPPPQQAPAPPDQSDAGAARGNQPAGPPRSVPLCSPRWSARPLLAGWRPRRRAGRRASGRPLVGWLLLLAARCCALSWPCLWRAPTQACLLCRRYPSLRCPFRSPVLLLSATRGCAAT